MIGQTVSHYRILEKLGEGGMGEVYLAHDTELNRRVALKFLPAALSGDPEVRARFKREAQALAALNHPHIVTVHGVAEHQGRPFIVMEHVSGKSLRELGAQSDLPLDQIVVWAIQLAEGLAVAHRSNIVHRDIKSDNLLMSPDARVKILDFGLAIQQGSSRVTREGSTVGTAAYMSPEQAMGRDVDHRSDLFSLGVVLYELTARQLPFKGEHQAAVAYAVMHEDPAPLARFVAHVPDEWQRIVAKCLAKNPAERYQSASDLAADLKALQKRLSGDPAGAKPAAEEKPSIAVLPFANMSADPENEFFSDGLSEELLNVLARNPDLKVTGRTSSFAFKGKQQDLRDIGQKLGVATLLEGSVRKAGSRVRITAQLIKVSDGFHLWSQTYDRVLDDIFAVQDDIARAVEEALKVTLLGSKVTPHAAHPEAYRLYLQARYLVLRHSKESLETAVRLFGQSLELDASNANTWAGLAWAYHSQIGYGTAELSGGYLTAKQAAERALALDPGCAEAHRAMGAILHNFELDWEGARDHLKQVVKLEPSNPRGHSSLGFHLICLGHLTEAVRHIERSVELDPLAPGAYNNLGLALSAARRSEEAVRAYGKVLELSPVFVSARTRMGVEYLALNRPEEALALIEQEQEGGYRDFGLALVHHALGAYDRSRSALAALTSRGAQWAFQLAIVHSHLGEHDAAFAWLEKAREERDSGLPLLAVTPLLSGLHSDPRWPALLKRLKLAI